MLSFNSLKPSKELFKKWYGLVAEEDEDARVCEAISEEACREVPGNFFIILSSLLCTKLGDLLSSPKIVLSWLLSSIGASSTLIALLVPIRESGALIPQLVIGSYIRTFERRGLFWSLGSLIQGLCILAILPAVTLLPGKLAAPTVLVLMLLFSLARGLCSIAMKDVQGKLVPKTRRGRLSGLASSLSGLATLLLALWLTLDGGARTNTILLWMLGAAGVLWLMAAIGFTRIQEFPGETGGGRNGLGEALKNLQLLKTDLKFRHFVVSRALLLSTPLAMPFLVIVGQEQLGELDLLGLLVLASGLAISLSSWFWGRLADRSSRLAMVAGGLLGALGCLAGGWLAASSHSPLLIYGLLPVIYFVLALGHAGIRIGRKTYLVDMAEGVRRTDYVATSNALIGIILLLVGLMGSLAALISNAAALIGLGFLTLLGSFSSWRMARIED